MRAENPVFFLDYDGTLAPIAQRPEEAFPHPEAPRVLRALMERHPVYVVTGRRVRDLEPLLPLPGLPVVGGHGLEEGVLFGEVRPLFPVDLGPLRARLPSCPGVRVEDKGFALALHYRGAEDEEKARAKERIYSFRDEFGQWDPKNQRPELWNLYNGRHRRGEHIRVFPISNWTEMDVWQYIEREGIEIPSIYYAHRRSVVRRDGMLLAVTPYLTLLPEEEPEEMLVRFRTVGDATCTGAVESPAANAAEVIVEVAASRITERGATRADDRISEAGMEDRKREGYF